MTVDSEKNGNGETERRRRDRIKGVLAFIYNWTFEKLNRGYNKALEYYLRRRLDLAFILIILLSGTYFYGFQKVEFAGYHQDDPDEFRMRLRFPDHFTIEDKNAYFKTLENIVETNKVEFGIRSYRVEFDKRSYGELDVNHTAAGPPNIPRE